MNYEARIATLKSKGLLDEKQAEKLNRTLSEKSASVVRKRNYTLEVIAVGILALLFVYLSMQVGLAEGSTEVENVSETLNAVRSGIGGGQSFGLLFVSVAVFVFVLFYLLVHRYYNKLWKWQENILAYGEMIADLEKRKEALEEKVASLLENQAIQRNGDVLINTDSPDATKQAMQTVERLTNELGKIQNDYTMLKARCRTHSGKFPYTLAAVAGTLPTCK